MDSTFPGKVFTFELMITANAAKISKAAIVYEVSEYCTQCGEGALTGASRIWT